MAIGKLIEHEFATFTDPDTGALIERLTSPKVTCHAPKQTCRYTSRDGSLMLYVGEYGDTRQVYAMNLFTGKSVQVTSGRGICEYDGIWLDTDDTHALVLQGEKIWRIDLETLLRKSVYRSEEGWVAQCFSMSEDGRYLVITESERSSVPTALEEPDWSYFALSTIAAPHCRILVLDRKSGEVRVAHDEHCWLGWATLRPGDPGTVLYCHEGPFDFIDARMWLVDAAGNVRCVRETPRDAIVVGESWAYDGSGIYYVYTDKELMRNGSDTGRSSRVCVTDFETLKTRDLMECHLYAHCSGSSNHLFAAGDASNGIPLHLFADQGHAEGVIPDDYLYMFRVGKWWEVRLCHHGTSWNNGYGTNQDAHPHPSFSADGRYLTFTSDRDGKPAIYRVDLTRFLWERGRAKGPFELGGRELPDATWGFPSTY